MILYNTELATWVGVLWLLACLAITQMVHVAVNRKVRLGMTATASRYIVRFTLFMGVYLIAGACLIAVIISTP